ncbi:hypothetical protein ALC57_06434, partial [Trachymyrmex cornetzi]
KPRQTHANIRIMNKKCSKPPCIVIPSPDILEERGNFMIDTGSDLNLIKRSVLKEEVKIDTLQTFDLSGITKGRTRTIGIAKLHLFNAEIPFHVVPDTFPIFPDGILGTEFFQSQKATIDYLRKSLIVNGIPYFFHYNEIVTIPARTRKQIYIRIANPEIKYGYVPKLNAGPQVYLGNAVVSNRNGKGHLYVINTSNEDIALAIPTVSIHPFQESDDDSRETVETSLLNDSYEAVEISLPNDSCEIIETSLPNDSCSHT